MHAMVFYLVSLKNVIPMHAITWMNSKAIILSENVTKQILYDFMYVKCLKQMNFHSQKY